MRVALWKLSDTGTQSRANDDVAAMVAAYDV